MMSKHIFVRNAWSRPFSSSSFLCKWDDKIVWEKDANKRPSDLEIKRKGLPKNTPTLGERVRRQDGGPLYVPDRKGGYFKGPTGTIRDYIDPKLTSKEVVTQGFHNLKTEIVKWKSELGQNDIDKLPKDGEYRTEWTFDSEER